MKSIQDQGAVSGCYGCGPDNAHGNQIKSFIEGDLARATFQPQPYHCAGSPEIVYGGLLASLIDCHSCNFAIARHYAKEGRAIGSEPKIFCVTAQLNISYIKPTRISSQLELIARLESEEGRKTWVNCEVFSEGEVTVRGKVLLIRI
jgi:acyl-coenzyme A thioesterase PaaI-like protein